MTSRKGTKNKFQKFVRNKSKTIESQEKIVGEKYKLMEEKKNC